MRLLVALIGSGRPFAEDRLEPFVSAVSPSGVLVAWALT